MNPIRTFLKFLTVILVVGLLMVTLPLPVHAQLSATCQEALEYLDLDADGRAEAIVLGCQFAPDTHDELTIFKQSGEISMDIPWQQAITYENETWVFDHGTKEKASLIINFKRDEAALVAELYDDRDADGEVSYQIENGQVIITESKYWTGQVVAAEGWWIHDGIPNYNLHILVDGDVEGMFIMEAYRKFLETDGEPDYDIRIYDMNHNGKPEFDKRMELTDWVQGSVGLGTQMMVNWMDDELPFSGGFSLWPYLDLAHPWTEGSRVIKNSASAPIMFEPTTGRIEAVGEFVASRGGEHNCFFYSAIPWIKGQVNETNFESPFCFYDLAQDNDGIPELQVRALYWPPKDPAFEAGTISEPFEWIRYSWDPDNTRSWRFAVGLIGRHLEDGMVTFPEGIKVRTIPYSKFPAWVTSHTWNMAVFSEHTGEQYWTSEGVYAVSYPEDTKFTDYFTGESDSIPSPEYNPFPNFRMEWALNFNRQPYLYFSPVDHHLHLLGASGGRWTIDENHSIQYKNLDEGDLINQWLYLVKGQPEKSLVVLNDLIMLHENTSIAFRFSRASQSQFITLPPSNHNEWKKMGAYLEQNKPAFAPEDFNAMLTQFGEADGSITGASWRDLREINGGFRFILTLQKGFQVGGEDLLGVSGRAPGQYAVSYDGTFQLAPFTPTDIELSFAPEQPSSNLPTEYVEKDIEINLRNSGQEDAQEVQVRLIMEPPGQEVSSTDPQTVTLLAGQSALVHLLWTPSHPGEWKLWAFARWVDANSNYHTNVTAEKVVKVQPAQETNRKQELSAFGVVAPWQVVLLLAGIAMVTGLTGWVLTRPPGDEEEPQRESAAKAGRE